MRLSLKKGLSFDIWVDWLSVEEMLATPGFLTPYPDWQRKVTDAEIAALRTDGFDFVRLPMDPSVLLALGREGRSPLLADMRRGASRVLDAGLNVIVDLHSIPRPDEVWGTDDVVRRLWPDYLALVAEVGAVLDGLPPDRVAFEVLNEPTNDCDAVWQGAASVWPPMLKDLHEAARGAAPDLPLVLSGACWGGVDGLNLIDPALIGDDNVIWSFHSYQPFAFTHQGAVWVEGIERFITGLAYPPSAMTDADAAHAQKQAEARMAAETGTAPADDIAAAIAAYRALPDSLVVDEVARAADWADRHGIARSRILLGEFGALRMGPEGPFPKEWQLRFLEDKRRAAESFGFGWSVWNWAGDMGVTLLDDPQRRTDPDMARALGLTPP